MPTYEAVVVKIEKNGKNNTRTKRLSILAPSYDDAEREIKGSLEKTAYIKDITRKDTY